jgi:hypothetical protein
MEWGCTSPNVPTVTDVWAHYKETRRVSCHPNVGEGGVGMERSGMT